MKDFWCLQPSTGIPLGQRGKPFCFTKEFVPLNTCSHSTHPRFLGDVYLFPFLPTVYVQRTGPLFISIPDVRFSRVELKIRTGADYSSGPDTPHPIEGAIEVGQRSWFKTQESESPLRVDTIEYETITS